RRHTRFSRDWSSDVCSSDLCPLALYPQAYNSPSFVIPYTDTIGVTASENIGRTSAKFKSPRTATGEDLGVTSPRPNCPLVLFPRSDERRVGKEVSDGWSRYA